MRPGRAAAHRKRRQPLQLGRVAGANDKSSARGKQEGRKAFLLRLPPELLAQLKAWATQDLRSLNGQLEFLLREAVKRRRGEDR